MKIVDKFKRIFTLPVALVLGVIGLILLLIIGNNALKPQPNAPEYTPPNAPATLKNGEELYRQIDDSYQFNALRDDLAVFARKTIEAYKSDEVRSVIFTVKGTPAKSNDNISFKGEFEEGDGSVEVSLTKLRNSRIKLSITNTKSKTNIDGDLTSNSQRNQFVATLPVDDNKYSIEFYVPDDSFIIKLYEVTAENDARQKLVSGIGSDDLTNETVEVVPLGDFSERQRIPAPIDNDVDNEITPDDY